MLNKPKAYWTPEPDTKTFLRRSGSESEGVMQPKSLAIAERRTFYELDRPAPKAAQYFGHLYSLWKRTANFNDAPCEAVPSLSALLSLQGSHLIRERREICFLIHFLHTMPDI